MAPELRLERSHTDRYILEWRKSLWIHQIFAFHRHLCGKAYHYQVIPPVWWVVIYCVLIAPGGLWHDYLGMNRLWIGYDKGLTMVTCRRFLSASPGLCMNADSCSFCGPTVIKLIYLRHLFVWPYGRRNCVSNKWYYDLICHLWCSKHVLLSCPTQPNLPEQKLCFRQRVATASMRHSLLPPTLVHTPRKSLTPSSDDVMNLQVQNTRTTPWQWQTWPKELLA